MPAFIVMLYMSTILAISKRKNKILGSIIAYFVKYLILFAAVSYIVDVPDKIAKVMSLPQLITALSGGVIAILLYNALRFTGMGITKDIVKDKK